MATRKQKKRGGVTFRNNTKPPKNFTEYHIPNSYLNDLKEQMSRVIPNVSEYHAMDAELLAHAQATYNSPDKMKNYLESVYNPQPLAPIEEKVARRLVTQGIHRSINRVAAAPMPEPIRQKSLNRLRYDRAIAKLHHMYEKEHAPRFLHPEWNHREEVGPREKRDSNV